MNCSEFYIPECYVFFPLSFTYYTEIYVYILYNNKIELWERCIYLSDWNTYWRRNIISRCKFFMSYSLVSLFFGWTLVTIWFTAVHMTNSFLEKMLRKPYSNWLKICLRTNFLKFCLRGKKRVCGTNNYTAWERE